LEPYLQFTKIATVKDIAGKGMFLLGLRCKEFSYNSELKSFGANHEVDGIEPSNVVQLVFQAPREEGG
jgi:hypothetical protein